MNWVRGHWRLFVVLGILFLTIGSAITIGALAGLIKNRTNLEGEPAYGFSTKTWNPFPLLNLNEGDEATFRIEIRPNTSLTDWGFFLYIRNSSGQAVKTISRGSVFGGAFRNVEFLFTAPYADTYEISAYASCGPPNSLRIYPSVSILESRLNLVILGLGIIFLAIGVCLLSVTLYQRSSVI